LDILPTLKQVELVPTDPPYGIGVSNAREIGYRGNNVYEPLDWDNGVPDAKTLQSIIGLAENSIIFGGNYFTLKPSRCWYVWDKGEGFYNRTYAEAELAYTTFDRNVKIFKYDPLARGDYKGKKHPTQKPIALFVWCLEQSKTTGTVLDPFLGSGTTAVACMRLKRKCIGIELEEKYCEISAKRCEEARTGLTPSEQEAEQGILFGE